MDLKQMISICCFTIFLPLLVGCGEQLKSEAAEDVQSVDDHKGLVEELQDKGLPVVPNLRQTNHLISQGLCNSRHWRQFGA